MSTMHEREQPETASPRRRLFLGVAAVLGLLLALGAGWYAAVMLTGANRLARVVAELDRTDPNWRLEDIEKTRAEIPEEKNGARVCVVIGAMVPGNWPSNDLFRLLEAGSPPEVMTPEQLKQLRVDLDRLAGAVGLARALSELPNGRHRLALADNPYATILEDQQRVRRVVSLLRLDAVRLAQEDRPDLALRSVRAGFHAASSLGDEPFIISQLIRTAGVHQAGEAAERVLALGEPGDGELAALAKSLAAEDGHQGLLAACRGERAAIHKVVAGLGSGRFRMGEMGMPVTPTLAFREKFLGWQLRMQIRGDHADLLRLCNRSVEIAALPPHEQIPEERALDREIRASRAGNPAADLLLTAQLKAGQSDRRRLAMARCLLLAVALERHRRETGSWADRLADVPPRLLKAVPLDPFDGKPLRYLKRPDGVTVYSVGPNGSDDGGTRIDRSRVLDPGVDVGYRLWDANKRRKGVVAVKPEGMGK